MNAQSLRKSLLSIAIASATALLAAGAAFADIKIGFNVPLTGFAAADGQSSLNGAKLAVAQANAAGGSDVPATKAFLADYRKANNAGADRVAAASFTATNVLIEGLKKSGGKGGKVLHTAMAGGTFVTPIGKLTFNNLNEVAKDIQVQVQVQVVKDKTFRRHSVVTDTVLLVEQNTERVLSVAHDVCALESGQTVWKGAAADACNDPTQAAAFLGLH